MMTCQPSVFCKIEQHDWLGQQNTDKIDLQNTDVPYKTRMILCLISLKGLLHLNRWGNAFYPTFVVNTSDVIR